MHLEKDIRSTVFIIFNEVKETMNKGQKKIMKTMKKGNQTNPEAENTVTEMKSSLQGVQGHI